MRERQEQQAYTESNAFALEQLEQKLYWGRVRQRLAVHDERPTVGCSRIRPLLLLVLLVVVERLLLGNSNAATLSFTYAVIVLDILAAAILLHPSRRARVLRPR
jgi:hypothetical protein